MSGDQQCSGDERSPAKPEASLLSYNGSLWRALSRIGPLTLTTGVSLVVGYNYYQGYYRRLGVPEGLVPLANLDLLTASLKVFLSLTLAMTLVFTFERLRNPPTIRLAIERNIVFSVSLISVAILLDFLVLQSWIAAGTFVALIVVSILTGRLSETIIDLLFYKNNIVVYTLISLGVLLVTFVPNDRGERDAVRLIEGQANGRLVSFQMTNPSSVFEGRSYVLVCHSDDLYIVTDPEDVAPENPTVYVIPSTDVLSLSIVTR